jgi:hypothetical protein
VESVKPKLTISFWILIAQLALFPLASVAGAGSSTDRFMEFSKKCGEPADSTRRMLAAADGEQGLKPPMIGEPVTARLEGVPLQSQISNETAEPTNAKSKTA